MFRSALGSCGLRAEVAGSSVSLMESSVWRQSVLFAVFGMVLNGLWHRSACSGDVSASLFLGHVGLFSLR